MYAVVDIAGQQFKVEKDSKVSRRRITMGLIRWAALVRRLLRVRRMERDVEEEDEEVQGRVGARRLALMRGGQQDCGGSM